MGAVKAMFGDLVGRLLFHETTVSEVRAVSPHFRRITLEGAGLRGASWSPGDKVQALLADGEMRTYTPFAFDAKRGAFDVLVYLHGGGTPGTDWGRRAAKGDTVRVFGPRASLPLASMAGAVTLFGDETSFAAAHTLRALRGKGDELAFVFEVASLEESQVVLDTLGLENCALIARRAGDGHLDAAVDAVAAALAKLDGATLALTGRAQSIQVLRAQLKARRVSHGAQKVRAYWSVGRKGLD